MLMSRLRDYAANGAAIKFSGVRPVYLNSMEQHGTARECRLVATMFDGQSQPSGRQSFPPSFSAAVLMT